MRQRARSLTAGGPVAGGGAAAPPDAPDDEAPPDDDDVVTRVRLDEISGELVISEWHRDVKISEHRELPRED